MKKQTLLTAAVSALAASAIAGGVAWASIPDSGGVIQGCYTKVGGVLRVIDTAKDQKCTSLEAPISWNQQGPKGADGASGVSPTVAPLQVGDANCAAGGAAITDASGSTAYVCNGANGQAFAGTFTSANGEYSINVTDTGITLKHGGSTSIRLVGDNLELRSGGSTSLNAGTTASVEAGTDFVLRGGGTGLVQSFGQLFLKGSAINLN